MAKTMTEETNAHLAGEFPQVPVNVYLRQPAPYASLEEINEVLAGKHPGRTVGFIPPETVVQLEVLKAVVQGDGLRRAENGQYVGAAAILEGSRPALGSTDKTARWSVRKVLALPPSAAAVPAQPASYSAGTPEPIEGWSLVDGHRYVRPVKAVSSGTISLGVDLPPASGSARVGAGLSSQAEPPACGHSSCQGYDRCAQSTPCTAPMIPAGSRVRVLGIVGSFTRNLDEVPGLLSKEATALDDLRWREGGGLSGGYTGRLDFGGPANCWSTGTDGKVRWVVEVLHSSLCTLPTIPAGAKVRVTGTKLAGEVTPLKPWEGTVTGELRRNEDGTYSGEGIDAGDPGGELGISRCMVELISLPTETAWIPRMPIYARAGAKKGENVPVAGEGWGGYAVAGEDIAVNDKLSIRADGTVRPSQEQRLQTGYGPALLLATSANPSAREVGFQPIEGTGLSKELFDRIDQLQEQLLRIQLLQAGSELISAGAQAGAIGQALARRIDAARRSPPPPKDDPMKIRVDTTEAEAKLDRLKEKADAAAAAAERALAAAEKLEAPMSDQTPTRTEKALAVLSADAADAGYRIAGRQLVKLTREPLVAYLRGKGVDSATIAAMTAFLDTEIGRALWAGLVGAGLSALPQGEGALGEVAARLARELRVSSLAGAGDVVADLLSEPLRRVVSDYLSAHPEAAPLGALPAEIPRVRAPEVVAQEVGTKAGAR